MLHVVLKQILSVLVHKSNGNYPENFHHTIVFGLKFKILDIIMMLSLFTISITKQLYEYKHPIIYFLSSTITVLISKIFINGFVTVFQFSIEMAKKTFGTKKGLQIICLRLSIKVTTVNSSSLHVYNLAPSWEKTWDCRFNL